ncbi:hypothetical protein N9M01_01250 [Luminiphilus sp.]|nr:hypothetical protein [Luminiphilus sp.]
MSGLQAVLARYQVQQNPLKTERRVELAAIVLLVLLLASAIFGGLGLVAGHGPKPVLPSSDSLEAQKLQLDSALTGEQAVEILSRPLFWQSRRPLVPPPKVVAKTKPKAPKKLKGVVVMGVYGAGDALGLIATIDGAFSRISKGQSVKGWQFDAYEDGAAVFVSGGKRSVLPLELTAPSVKVVSVPKETEAGKDTAKEQADKEATLTFGG